MGQTLENGVYLPSEGERNCYAGLKTNWEILDQKVADVTALQQAVAGALHRQIVTQLPTEDIDPNTIYMILSGTSATENVYNEYMYVNNAWELIGTSATDLTNYYTKGDVDGLLLLKANASDLTSHTGDTTIHVTASDKTKWNTVALIKQLRLVNTQVGSATTIAFANIDDTNGIKVGDKCMDLDGRMFEITAVDTTNQTVTVGSALIDLAQDSDVVHKSGDETVGGNKTFTDNISLKSLTAELGVTGGNTKVIFTDKNLLNLAGITFGNYESSKLSYCRFHIYGKDSNNQEVENFIELSYVNNNQTAYFRPNKSSFVNLGTVSNRWSKVYANEYYYGANNVEFSTKFVTTDTNQTISGNKTFSSINGVEPSSLSLPSDRSARIDISSYFTNTGTGDTNTYTVPANGYINLTLSELTNVHCFSSTSNNLVNYCQTFTKTSNSTGVLYVLFPVRKNDVFLATWYTTTTVNVGGAYFIPCQGNV